MLKVINLAAQGHFNSNKRVYLLQGIVFLLGLLLGALYIFLTQAKGIDALAVYLDGFLSIFSADAIDVRELFIDSIFKELRFVIIWFLVHLCCLVRLWFFLVSFTRVFVLDIYAPAL